MSELPETVETAEDFITDAMDSQEAGDGHPRWHKHVALTTLVMALLTALGAMLASMSATQSLIERTQEIIEVNSLEGDRFYMETLKSKHEILTTLGETPDQAETKAIAAFERCLVTGSSEYDYYESFQRFAKMDPEDLAEMKEDDPDSYKQYEALERAVGRNSMSASAIRGRKLFFSEKVNCAACHVGANLTDEKYHNLGIGMDQKEPDLGRYVVTAVEKDKGAFKTPTIRNVTLSAPYMHDGSLTTLEEVVEHYAKGGTPNMWLSDKIKKIEMTKRDKRDLVEFMRACNGSFPIVETGRLPQ
jgi:cytochrome c peroxidase